MRTRQQLLDQVVDVRARFRDMSTALLFRRGGGVWRLCAIFADKLSALQFEREQLVHANFRLKILS